MNINKNLTTVNYTKGGKLKKYIVIHYTGNATDTAKGNANYFKSAKRGASAHYFVDETSIYQVVEDTDTSWAVGKNYGKNNLFGTVTNANSISIEMCSTNGKIGNNTYKNTVELTRYLMSKHNIPASNVYRHWDVCSKVCPGWNGWGANGCDSSIWNQFKNDIANGTVSTPVVKENTSSNTNTTSSSTILKVGSRGANVQDAQKKLIALGYNCGKSGADGIYGYGTKTAVKSFQSDHGLSCDGVIGDKTIGALNAAYNSKNSVKSNAKDYIRNAQAHMNNFAGTGIVIDGIWGANSRKGLVKCLQKALNLDYNKKLSEDGIRGNATNTALGNHYVKRGEKQYLVTFVEIGLMCLGYYNSTVESPGVFRVGLETAVKSFQSNLGLTNDGIAGKGTITTILKCLGC